MYVVAVANQKGGVAKTTTATNVADLAAERGQRVLLVDLDPQANATALTDAQPATGMTAFGDAEPMTMSEALFHAQKNPDATPRTGTVLSVAVRAGEWWSERLAVAPSSTDLANRSQESFAGAQLRLAAALSGADEHYDLVVIDCGPSLGQLFLNAMYAADGVLLVTEAAANALDGVPRTVKTLTDVRAVRAAAGDDRPELLGVVATNVPARETVATSLLGQMRSDYGDRLWGVVPRRALVRTAEGACAPIRAYGTEARELVDAYDAVCGRLLEHAGLAAKVVA